MSPSTIPHSVLLAGRRFGDRVAIAADGERVSFAQLAHETMRCARAFLAVGLNHGDVVGIWAPNSWRWVAAAAGAQALGGVVAPFNTRLRGREVAALIDAAGARLLVVVGEFLGTNYPASLGVYDMPGLERMIVLGPPHAPSFGRRQAWDAFLAEGERVAESEVLARLERLGADDLADIMFTSGTTGAPKGALFTQAKSLLAARTFMNASTMREGDHALAFGPFSHTAGYKGGWVAAMLCGCTLHAPNQVDAVSIMTLVQHERISFMPAPPTVLQAVLAHPNRQDFDLTSLRWISVGAAVVPIELVRRLKRELAAAIIATGYGLTEACGTATLTRPDDTLEVVANTAGRAVPGIALRCVSASGETVAPGQPGEILIRGDKVMLGYLNDSQATASVLDPDGWLRTGDLGRLDAAGNLTVTDRLKDMFIVGGFNCYPAEIERDLAGVPGVMLCAVIGVPDARLGEVGCAYVVRAPETALTEAELMAWCRTNLATYKVPRSIRFVESLPLNATGKVMKHMLRELV